VILAAVLLFSAQAPAATAAAGVSSGTARPQLLLIHGGSFLFEDPGFQARTESAAIAAGFVPHYLRYPLGDLRAAVLAARQEAARLRDRFGRDEVYAYGSSAGGTLAALLAGDGLVSAAVAKAPPSDLIGWKWPLSAYGPAYYEEIGVNLASRRRLSPLRRPMRRPLLVVQGRADRVVPIAMSEAFAAKFRNVDLWVVPGGHSTERTRRWVLGGALRWLARKPPSVTTSGASTAAGL
jgi:pimeloyl-ACP methyl ester carboxylesterase